MKIIVGKIVGGRHITGTSSKTGKPYSICTLAVSTHKGLFEGLPEMVSIPADKSEAVKAKLMSMPFGSEVCISVETQSRNDGPDQQVFQDFFNLQAAVK